MRVRTLYFIFSAVAIIRAFRAAKTHECKKKCYCDNSKHGHEDRIVGGHETVRNEFPFLVLLKDYTLMCGGTIITAKHVMTAAHCAEALSPERTKAFLGLHNLNSAHHPLGVVKMIKHPKYNNPALGPENYNCDIAIATVGEAIRFGPAIQPACIPTKSGVDYHIGEKLLVAGWGASKEEGEVQNALHKADVTVLDHERCRRNYKRTKLTVNDNMICAGNPKGGKDACQGDSGGPLMRLNTHTRKRIVIGVVSFGNGCGEANYPGVYTKVANFWQWIEQMVGSECLCSQS